jgi:hypothetical protein
MSDDVNALSDLGRSLYAMRSQQSKVFCMLQVSLPTVSLFAYFSAMQSYGVQRQVGAFTRL